MEQWARIPLHDGLEERVKENCRATIRLGDIEVICSQVEHEGQHWAVGATHVERRVGGWISGMQLVVYRVGWSDDPTATLEI